MLTEIGVGIAYAMRAMFYFDLVRIYSAEPYYKNPSAATTVKITESTTMAETRNNPRMTWDEAFEFMLKDLDAAEKYLEDYEREDVYTPDLNVVYGLKARVYLEKRKPLKIIAIHVVICQPVLIPFSPVCRSP